MILKLKKEVLARFRGDTKVKTLVEKPMFDFESISGDIELSLPATANVDVSFDSMTGDLNNEFGAGKIGAGESFCI